MPDEDLGPIVTKLAVLSEQVTSLGRDISSVKTTVEQSRDIPLQVARLQDRDIQVSKDIENLLKQVIILAEESKKSTQDIGILKFRNKIIGSAIVAAISCSGYALDKLADYIHDAAKDHDVRLQSEALQNQRLTILELQINTPKVERAFSGDGTGTDGKK